MSKKKAGEKTAANQVAAGDSTDKLFLDDEMKLHVRAMELPPDLDKMLDNILARTAQDPLERTIDQFRKWSKLDFAAWLMVGAERWTKATSMSSAILAFQPLVLSLDLSLAPQLVAFSRRLDAQTANVLQEGLIAAIGGWSGVRPIAVLHSLVDIAIEFRPLGLSVELNRFLGTNILDRETVGDFDRTIDRLVTLAASYQFSTEIEDFFEELRRRKYWRPSHAARYLLARSTREPTRWLEFLRSLHDDFDLMQRDVPHFQFGLTIELLISVVGISNITRSLSDLNDEEDWIRNGFRQSSQASSIPLIASILNAGARSEREIGLKPSVATVDAILAIGGWTSVIGARCLQVAEVASDPLARQALGGDVNEQFAARIASGKGMPSAPSDFNDIQGWVRFVVDGNDWYERQMREYVHVWLQDSRIVGEYE